jgi:hypothetical protein
MKIFMEKELTIDIEGEDEINQNALKDPEIIEEIVIEELSVDNG